MEYKSKSFSVALTATALILFLILVPSAASAAPLTIAETQITTSGNASNADIYSNRIVWQDARNGGNDVYMYDSSTKKETRITKSGSAVNPAIYGNLIVWSDGRNGNGEDIYMYDLSAKKEMRITKSGNSSNPDIYGNKIVWDGGGIFLYDLSTKKVTKIAEDWDNSDDFAINGGQNSNPVIYGNRIVWYVSDYSDVDTSYAVYLYDLSTKKGTEIASNMNEYLSFPDICNDNIVYAKLGYGDTGIYMYRISTQKVTQITTSESASDPRIYGNRIVWKDVGTEWNHPDLYMYDFSTKKESTITNSGSVSKPSMYGDWIVWQDIRNGNSDIYLATLSSSNPLVAAFTASPLSGKAPLTVKFTDKSTGSPTSWYWNFGDKYTSTVKNPVHKYTKAGKYTVTLKVTSAAGSNTVTKSSYINVLNPPVAAFSAYPLSGKTVRFTDKSTNNPASWYWDFGDKTSSKLKNPPVHKYSQSGKKYTVSLTVKNAAGTSISKKTITTLR
jgi:beta propeller repeat protein